MRINPDVLTFKLCSPTFYPYIEKVIKRLPADVVHNIENDTAFRVISLPFDWSGGACYHLEGLTSCIVILDDQILDYPKFFIIEMIAHELAHRMVGDGDADIKEREAVELEIKWGFGKERNLAREFIENPRKFGYEE